MKAGRKWKGEWNKTAVNIEAFIEGVFTTVTRKKCLRIYNYRLSLTAPFPSSCATPLTELAAYNRSFDPFWSWRKLWNTIHANLQRETHCSSWLAVSLRVRIWETSKALLPSFQYTKCFLDFYTFVEVCLVEYYFVNAMCTGLPTGSDETYVRLVCKDILIMAQ